MKKFAYFLLLVAIALSSNAQTVGEAFYIYRNDGQFNAFFRDEVDSIAYSNYDADSVYYDDVVTQLIYTQDSLYRIPLAAIDSVGFVQPETIYKKGVTHLAGKLFDYLISENDMTLNFNVSLPANLIPKVGDDLVCMELTEKLPYGFAGKVRQVTKGASEISVLCDSVELTDVVERFYGVAIIGDDEGYEVRRSTHKREPQVITKYYDLPNTPINIPIDISKNITKKSIFDINGKAELNVNIKPNTKLKATLVIDGINSHTSIHVDSKLVTSTRVDVCGEANTEFKLNLVLNKGNLRGPWGIPLYCAHGPKLELSGEILLEFTIDATLNVVSDITYTPQMLFPSLLTPFVIANSITGRANISGFNLNFDKFGARATIKIGPYFQFGIGNNITWFGLDAEDGAKIETESLFDFDRLKEANKSTLLYDELKSNLLHTEIKPYVGLHFMINHNEGDFTFKVGPEYDEFGGTWFKGSLIPTFEDTKLVRSTSDNMSLDATTKIYGASPIPYSVGFSLFDSKGNRVQDPIYYDKKYHFLNQFPSYSGTFSNLNTNEKYTVYPTIKLFNYDMLASPSAELGMQFPVIYNGYEVTKAQYKQGGFTNDGITYNYRFDVTVSFYLRDRENVIDWGYVYLDPNGKTKEISLMQFGYDKDDNRYAYFRNKSDDTVCLYGYVKYANGDIIYGEPIYLGLHYECQLCPDNNHPHMLDLGLPSGTKWACCNLGASSPEKWGGYYAWGETEEKECDYLPWTYQHAIKVNDEDGWGDYFLNEETGDKFIYSDIGSNISGTQYDAATALWSDKWCMPTKEQFRELYMECSNSGRTLYNGCITLVGPNGTNAIIIPEQGYRVNKDVTVYDVYSVFGSHPAMHYWTSEIDVYSKEWHQWTVYGVYEWHSDAWEVKSWGNQIQDRCHGLPIRPVAKEAK